jgi:hypothetical protein
LSRILRNISLDDETDVNFIWLMAYSEKYIYWWPHETCSSENCLVYFAVSPCINNPCENNGTCSVDVNGNATCKIFLYLVYTWVRGRQFTNPGL